MYLLLCELYFRCYFNYPCAMLPIFMRISFKICQILANFKKRLSAKLRLSAHCSKLWPSASLTLSAFLNIDFFVAFSVVFLASLHGSVLPPLFCHPVILVPWKIVVGPFPGPCASGSYMHRAAPQLTGCIR